jgi:hypothetical protein
MPWIGASLEDLDSLAQKLDQSATDIEATISELAGFFAAMWWKGDDADEFRTSWEAEHSKQLSALATDCRNAAADVRRQREAQAEASRAKAAADKAAADKAAADKAAAAKPTPGTTTSGPTPGPTPTATPPLTFAPIAPAPATTPAPTTAPEPEFGNGVGV